MAGFAVRVTVVAGICRPAFRGRPTGTGYPLRLLYSVLEWPFD